MIHRDNRRFYESASCLGQIISRRGPVNLTVGDVDLLSRKGLRSGTQLLRMVEHFQATAPIKAQQRRTFELVAEVIHHCIECPRARYIGLSPASGLFVVKGPLGAATSGHRETRFCGPQQIIRFRDDETRTVLDEEELLTLF
jgi:hypothetical protein